MGYEVHKGVDYSGLEPLGHDSGLEISLDLPQLRTILFPTGQIFEGTLNRNFQYRDEAGRLYLLRVPKEDTPIKEDLMQKYPEQGFSPPIGSHRYRSILEQFIFMRDAAAKGIKVLMPIAIAGDFSSMIIPFVENAQPLDEYLKSGRTEAVTGVLDNLFHAHSEGIVFGDRWGANTLVTPTGIIEIDFDIAFEGEFAREFEIGKLLYHIVHFSTDRDVMLKLLEDYFHRNRTVYFEYNLELIKFFIGNHFKLYGGEQTTAIDTTKDLNIGSVTAKQAERLLEIISG